DRFQEIPRLRARPSLARRRPRFTSQRREAHSLSSLESLFRLSALSVYAQFALPDGALGVGGRQPRERRPDEGVGAHTGFIGAHRGGLYAAPHSFLRACLSFAQYSSRFLISRSNPRSGGS